MCRHAECVQSFGSLLLDIDRYAHCIAQSCLSCDCGITVTHESSRYCFTSDNWLLQTESCPNKMMIVVLAHHLVAHEAKRIFGGREMQRCTSTPNLYASRMTTAFGRLRSDSTKVALGMN